MIGLRVCGIEKSESDGAVILREIGLESGDVIIMSNTGFDA